MSFGLPHQAVNFDLGSFNSDVLPFSEVDKELDKESLNPGKQVGLKCSLLIFLCTSLLLPFFSKFPIVMKTLLHSLLCKGF